MNKQMDKALRQRREQREKQRHAAQQQIAVPGQVKVVFSKQPGSTLHPIVSPVPLQDPAGNMIIVSQGGMGIIEHTAAMLQAQNLEYSPEACVRRAIELKQAYEKVMLEAQMEAQEKAEAEEESPDQEPELSPDSKIVLADA